MSKAHCIVILFCLSSSCVPNVVHFLLPFRYSLTFIYFTEKLNQENGSLDNGQRSSDNGSSSNSSTPTHSRHPSDLTTMGSLASPDSIMSKSVGDVFNGFVIAVHRKMVCFDRI